MWRKRWTNLVLAIIIFLFGIGAIVDLYQHRLRAGHPLSSNDEYVLGKAILLLAGGIIGILATMFGWNRKS